MNRVFAKALVLAVLLWGGGVPAATLSFVPPVQTVNQGDPVAVDILISGLGAGTAPSVGAFDLDLEYDPLVLTATGVDFGPLLGDLSLVEALASFSVGTPGLVDLAESSLLTPAELDALQPASFVLATVRFTATGGGSSGLSLSETSVDDAFAAPLTVSTDTGSITVAQAIPEPGVLPLLVLGLALAQLGQRRRVCKGSSWNRNNPLD